MTEAEWGPWIEHDGNGCPCVGQFVHRVYEKIGVNPYGSLSNENFGIANGTQSWRGGSDKVNAIVRYRVRKPRAMKLLQAIAANPPKRLIKEAV